MTYEHLFPTPDDIPAEHRLDSHAADACLVDGERRQRAGPTKTAYGPVFVRTGGSLERPSIGHQGRRSPMRGASSIAPNVGERRSRFLNTDVIR